MIAPTKPRTALAAALVAMLAMGGLMPGATSPSFATGAKPSTDPQADPVPCVAAAIDDADRIIAVCSALIDNAKTSKPDRIRALIARAGAYDRKEMLGSAIGDCDAALRLDPALADVFNTRGELWRKKGDRRRALADFAAAIKLNPDHPAARGNHKSLAQQLERLGALTAVYSQPGINCAATRLAVEKAICGNPELAILDREINAVNSKVVRAASSDSPQAGRALQREQDDFVDRRNAGFGQPGYDLAREMRKRLDHLLAVARY
jgi:tetratricopeptide (TPR) repeat protein